ncbi:MAG: serine/threonine-protein kinase [Myxococcota bacterium]
MPPNGDPATSEIGEVALLDMATRAGAELDRAVAAGPRTTAEDPAAADETSEGEAVPDVIGHYERIREVGRGGMGTVHLARDTRLGRRVALKLLLPGVGRSERFFLEARATARLQHEHIVVIHEVGEHRGAPYMVLEYLEGQPLRALLGQPLPARRALELALPIARALAHAHAHGIVHRDLKPENVFLTDAGVIKVLDFGIAKLVGLPDIEAAQRSARRRTLPTMAAMTRDGAVLGTLLYMAPEQWDAAGVDARADQYALGLMLWEMVAGRHPLSGLPLASPREVAIPPLSEAAAGVPRDLDLLVRRCLAPAAADRFPTTDALVEALVAASPTRFMAPLEHGESPYPGLGAFRERDAARFFGRSHDVARAVALLDHHALLAIVGPSGVGKSSLVRAGVIPALRALGPWESFTIRPGRQPLDALASFLVESTTQGDGDPGRRPDVASVAARLRREPGYLGAELRRRSAERRGRVVLFVDQLEESYTVSADPAESAAFFDCLLGAADDTSSPVRVVLSLRSDFLDRVGSSPAFADAVTRGLMLLRAPDRRQLEDALVGPAELAGYHFEDAGTVDAMLDALDGTAAALPLLQFAAGQLWEARDRSAKRLTRAAYDAMGGITGLLAAHADGVLTALGPEARTLARTCFLRLVTPERTRAVVDREDLLALDGDAAKVRALLDRLVDARILVVQARDADGSATYELAHEALLECWPTLARWLDEGASTRASSTSWPAPRASGT